MSPLPVRRPVSGRSRTALLKRSSHSTECWFVRTAMNTVTPTLRAALSSSATRLRTMPACSSFWTRRQHGVAEIPAFSARSASAIVASACSAFRILRSISSSLSVVGGAMAVLRLRRMGDVARNATDGIIFYGSSEIRK